ncbi:MAG: DUF1570 domain-containing protein [Planctomycetes bacterium]|nr:DUF1570 domain-containing protein [Planctomycetota bacterium]
MAAQDLQALLAAHEKQLYVLAQREAIVEDARRCAFGAKAIPVPPPEKLISGKLEWLDRGSHRVKLSYGKDNLADFAVEEGEHFEVLVHPLAFANDYEITMRGKGGAGYAGLWFDRIGDDYTMWSSGAHVDGGYLPALLAHYEGGKIVRKFREGQPEVGAYVCRFVVADREILYYENDQKKVAQKLARKKRPFGSFAVTRAFDEIEIKGTLEPGWLQGVTDQFVAERRAEFEKDWRPKEHLPEWLFEKPAGKTARPKYGRSIPGVGVLSVSDEFERVLDAYKEAKWREVRAVLAKAPADSVPPLTHAFVDATAAWQLGNLVDALAVSERALGLAPEDSRVRLLRIDILDDARRRADALALARQTAEDDPGDVQAQERLVVLLLRQGDAEGAERHVRDVKIRHGLWQQMQSLDQMLAMRRRGPAWTRTFTYTSANYEVSSDIDQKRCSDAASILESSLTRLKAQFGQIKEEQSKTRFRVFLFAGEQGYKDYCAKILGDAPSHTAGLYSPVLKQLLIWNVQKREDMDRTIRHESFHQYLDRVLVEPPVWFNEGMAEFWETAKYEGGLLQGGQVRRDHVALLIRSKKDLVPLAQFVHGARSDFYANAQLRYAQAWALVHFLRKGPSGWQKLFPKVWTALRGDAPLREAIDGAFAGVDWPRFETEFWEHLRNLK